MSGFANNPLTRKVQQEVTKKATQFATEQITKNGPKAMEIAGNAYKGLVNGLTSPTPPMPGKGGAADFVGQVGGAIAQEKFVKPVKSNIEKQAGQQISQAQTTVKSMVAKPVTQPVTQPVTKPRSGSASSGTSPMASNVAPTQKPVNTPSKQMGQGGATKSPTNRPMSPMLNLNKPMVPLVQPIQTKQPAKVALVKPPKSNAQPGFGGVKKSPSTTNLLKQTNKNNAVNRADE